MRLVAFILVACLVVAGLQALVSVLVVATIALLVFGIVFQPRQTLVVVGGLALWGGIGAFPAVGLGMLGVTGLAQLRRDQPP